MREKKSKGLHALLFLFYAGLLCWPAAASAQSHPKDAEWPTYAADLAGTRYRPLDQINASNFSDLEIAWRIKTDNFGDRPEYKLEGTPLMVNGVLYATAGSRRAVIALDPATGVVVRRVAGRARRGPVRPALHAQLAVLGDAAAVLKRLPQFH